MVSDKAEGDFTAEDEALLTQLATLASLGFQHIEARDEAERQRAQLDAVFDAMTDGVTVYSAEGVPVKCNQAEIAALGLDPVGGDRETLRKTLKVRHVDGRPVAPADLPSVRALRGETVGEEAFLFTNVNGEEFSILASGSPLCKDGKVVGALTVWRNITEREWLLQQIQRQVAELNAANRELELFAYSVSHDLRAPLRGIDGFANALLEDYADLLDDQGKRYLAFVRQESQRMGQLIDAVLELSRIARWEMRRGRVDLSELARQVARGLQLAEPERSVEFAIALGLMANGDARLLKVVLENLLENAWKFTSKRPTAKIEFGATEHEGSRAYYVRDDGAGFEPGYAGKLFGPFQRLHGEGEFPGTGIGLATVQRIVSRHGGRVWAEGALEGGATFYFTLLA
ncbi:MAG: hypothetical protein HY675_07795 [Chloroflexi bacterium]|nr:hypothetical protein [Chloroflexota bacterium]